METLQTQCKRCGTCCNNGGPALHTKDLTLIKEKVISFDNLITLRKGELAHNPQSGRLERVKKELIKIRGEGRDWCCSFLEKGKNGCRIYEDRPIACRILECWNIDELLKIVGKDTLTRLDLIEEDDPLRSIVVEHERRFPCPDLEKLADAMVAGYLGEKDDVQHIVNDELLFRTEVVNRYGFQLHRELFYFGRPIFQLLQPLGVGISETADGLRLQWPKLP